jgi:isopenicillin-N epimerase
MTLRDLFLLSPEVVYLNHGSFGACPRPVFETYQKWQRELERQPLDFLSEKRRFRELMSTARHHLADFVGAQADDLVFVPNATTGLNIVARSLDLQPGDEVLTSNHEYGALDRTWRFICRKRGAHYVRCVVPVPIASADEVVDTIWAAVTEHTRVLFLSQVTSVTAITLPIAPLLQRARERDILTVIDGAHVPGQLDLNLDELGADFYAGNCHKWLMAPKGAAFLHAKREVQSRLEPLVVSWGWESDDPGPSRFVDEQQWTGTRDPAAYLSVPAAIAFIQDHDWPTVQEICFGLVRQARERIGQLTGLPPLTPDAANWYFQMVTLPLPECDEAALQMRLREKYDIEILTARWQDRPYLRVCVQGYNTQQDIDTLVAALAELL